MDALITNITFTKRRLAMKRFFIIGRVVMLLGVGAMHAVVNAAGENSTPTQKAIVVTSPSRISLAAEAGATVVTPCFQFSVPIKSNVRGDGCRVYVAQWVGSNNFFEPYVSIELLNDTPKSATLEAAANDMLQAIRVKQEAVKKLENFAPGKLPDMSKPYDGLDGAYLGLKKAKIAGRPSVELRWGQSLGRPVNFPQLKCIEPSVDKVSASLAPYHSVKVIKVAQLLPGRYIWDANRQGLLMVGGMEKGCQGAFFHHVNNSLRML
jgi:hypothetical protein